LKLQDSERKLFLKRYSESLQQFPLFLNLVEADTGPVIKACRRMSGRQDLHSYEIQVLLFKTKNKYNLLFFWKAGLAAFRLMQSRCTLYCVFASIGLRGPACNKI
jgi:hypothetical protein